MFSSCPFCHITLPFRELECHVNDHLVEDELARDMELAQQIALASPSRPMNELIDYVELPYNCAERAAQTCSTSYNLNASDSIEIFDQEKIYNLVGLQVKSTFYRTEAGLMTLLRRCLESETKNYVSIICGHVDHYQSKVSEDSGWGCGWRNIQMMSSHLLMLRQDARDVLFGGSGFVPDIPSLQRWLEIAWERGFDVAGSVSFGKKIYGSKRWIGTTECAALFRSFGLRARIVDFDRTSSSSPSTLCAMRQQESAGDRRMIKNVHGPMDKFLHQWKQHDNNVQHLSNEKSWHHHHDITKGRDNFEANDKGHQVLMNWVWNYFTNDADGSLSSSQRVILSEKTPLYFQHNGHSRTIVGIQKQQGFRGSLDRFSLLVLDPGQRTEDLERSLLNNNGWQQLIKRGVHTLRKPQYQVCYLDAGLSKGEELEQLKTVDSIYVKL